MQIYVSGSLAYDRIMNFDGRFSDHILPDKIHVLNVCFNVNGLQEKLGGTAGNIAYGLAQLGESPTVLASLGRDGGRYMEWMKRHGIGVECVRQVEEEFTAGAYITTDQSDNQITGFNPGAMKFSCCFEPQGLDPQSSLAIVAPGNLEDLTQLPPRFRQLGLPFIFDPGQSLNILSGPQLVESITGALALISNDYELELITRKTGLDLAGLLGLTSAVITTKGDQGSVLQRAGGQVFIPVVPAREVKDPTGAGDAYRGGLLKGLAQGLSLEESCLWGATLASYAVASYGTQEYRLDPADFLERLARAQAGQA
ncbi:MAG: carbohydrate kinase family protein [Desulfarculus sp.]|nr:carbohydrate kinase family protein [Desulfarculus sp.]